MFSHLVTTEIDEQHKTVQYKIEFKHDKRIIKTVYINGNDLDWSKNLMSEINKFYRDEAPEFEKKQPLETRVMNNSNLSYTVFID